jgi:hypothetical protein
LFKGNTKEKFENIKKLGELQTMKTLDKSFTPEKLEKFVEELKTSGLKEGSDFEILDIPEVGMVLDIVEDKISIFSITKLLENYGVN